MCIVMAEGRFYGSGVMAGMADSFIAKNVNAIVAISMIVSIIYERLYDHTRTQ